MGLQSLIFAVGVRGGHTRRRLTTTYVFVGGASFITGLAMTWVVWKAPEYERPATAVTIEAQLVVTETA